MRSAFDLKASPVPFLDTIKVVSRKVPSDVLENEIYEAQRGLGVFVKKQGSPS